MPVSTCMPRPLLPTDRRFRAVMLQPFGFALHGAPSLRSWSPMTPASTFVPKTDTFSTTVSFTPRAKTPDVLRVHEDAVLDEVVAGRAAPAR
jgi:hypothetical protein